MGYGGSGDSLSMKFLLEDMIFEEEMGECFELAL